jgi:hypothetical protein
VHIPAKRERSYDGYDEQAERQDVIHALAASPDLHIALECSAFRAVPVRGWRSDLARRLWFVNLQTPCHGGGPFFDFATDRTVFAGYPAGSCVRQTEAMPGPSSNGPPPRRSSIAWLSHPTLPRTAWSWPGRWRMGSFAPAIAGPNGRRGTSGCWICPSSACPCLRHIPMTRRCLPAPTAASFAARMGGAPGEGVLA